jgi:phosphate/sulfate permease
MAVYNHKMKNFIKWIFLRFYNLIFRGYFFASALKWFFIYFFLFLLSKFVLESWEMGARAIMPSDRRDAPPTYRCIDRTIPHRCSSETTQKAMKYTKNKTRRRKKKKKKKKKKTYVKFFLHIHIHRRAFSHSPDDFIFFLFLGRCEIGRWMHT